MRNKIFFATLLLIALTTVRDYAVKANELNIYKINLDKLNDNIVIKEGTTFEAKLNKIISSKKLDKVNKITFKIPINEKESLIANGLISKSKKGGRFSSHSELQFITNDIYLNNGHKVYFPARSPSIQAVYPPHVNSKALNLARLITYLSLSASPFTLGTSLGASFLLNGILSANKNGMQDFFWGGFSGSGLGILESLFRKQPEITLEPGVNIPFVLTDDLKISKGIEKEKVTYIYINTEQATHKIKQLLEWGDLTGALEYAYKAGQEEIYRELIKKIAS